MGRNFSDKVTNKNNETKKDNNLNKNKENY